MRRKEKEKCEKWRRELHNVKAKALGDSHGLGNGQPFRNLFEFRIVLKSLIATKFWAAGGCGR